LKARRGRECNAATRQSARSTALPEPRVSLRGGPDDLTPIFWGWQRTKIEAALLREPPRSEKIWPATVHCRAVRRNIIENSFRSTRLFCSGTGFCPSVGDANPGQGNPGGRIARGKRLDEAQREFIVDVGRLRLRRGPGPCPASLTLMTRSLLHRPSRVRLKPRCQRPWGWRPDAAATEAGTRR
jgi:hypothetical protein